MLTGIENGSTPLQACVCAIDGDCIHSGLPETLRIHILESRSSRRVKLGWVRSTAVVSVTEGDGNPEANSPKCDFTIILVVEETGNLVPNDSGFNQTICRKGFNRCGCFLLRQSLMDYMNIKFPGRDQMETY